MNKTLLRSVPVVLTVLALAGTAAFASRRPNALKRHEAREACKAADSTLKGKKLKACIAEKMKAAESAPAAQ